MHFDLQSQGVDFSPTFSLSSEDAEYLSTMSDKEFCKLDNLPDYSTICKCQVERPAEARTFMSTPFTKKKPQLRGRASEFAYSIHSRVSDTSGSNDYILPDHSIPVYQSKIHDYLSDRMHETKTCEYQKRVSQSGTSRMEQELHAANEDPMACLSEIDETIE